MSAPGLKITNFHYSHMAMPAGNPSEYPKLVYPSPMSKDYRIVNSAEEEAAFYAALANKEPVPAPVASPEPEAPAPAAVLSGANDEREILLQVAKEKSIAVDGRWRIEKIRAALEAAQPKAE